MPSETEGGRKQREEARTAPIKRQFSIRDYYVSDMPLELIGAKIVDIGMIASDQVAIEYIPEGKQTVSRLVLITDDGGADILYHFETP